MFDAANVQRRRSGSNDADFSVLHGDKVFGVPVESRSLRGYERFPRSETDGHRRTVARDHHLVGLDASVVDAFDNVLLIRDPYDMLPSLTIQIPHATLADTGLARQSALFESLTLRGRQPAVIDAQVLLANPAGVLGALCEALGLTFDPAMLQWPAGPRPEDGVWAPHWYHAVHESTGFGPYTAKTEFPTHLEPLLEACRPHYNLLRPHVISARDPTPEAP